MREALTRIRRGTVAGCLALMLAGWGEPVIAQAQAPRDPRLAPAPNFIIKNNSLLIYSSGFSRPEEAKDYIEREHLTAPWTVTSNGTILNGPIYCPAFLPLFTKSDFLARSSPSASSAETPFRTGSRTTGQCLQWTGNNCTSFQCAPDSYPVQYNMQADCPTTHVFAARGGQPSCDCPAGQELERNAAGEWRCAVPQVANVANPACYRQDGSCPAANLVMPGVAAKVQTEVDYEGAGAHPLTFTRSFRSQGARPYVEPGAWSHWVHNWGRRIEVYPEPGYRGRAFVLREDASQRIYGTDGSGAWSTQQVGDRNVLTELRDAAGVRTGFQYTLWADDSVEHYDAAGRLLRVVQRNGWTNTLTYSDAGTPATTAPRPGLLISVRNHFGRELRFTYDTASRLAELLPPGAVSGTAPGSAASPVRYLHNETAGLGAGVPALGQLTSAVWQDGAVRRYHYENAQFPQWLTGRTDELGVRIGTYTYNTSGQLERSAGPNGMNAVDFIYRGTTTEMIDRSGATPVASVYTWETAAGVIRPTAVSGPCPQCGDTSARTTYTATGEVARRVDHDGRITFYSYDAKGRETERATFPAAYNTAATRPALTLAERVVSTKWHATWNLPTQVAEPQKVTAFTYGAGGRLTGESWTATTDATGATKFNAVKSGSTYATGYSYNANVLPSTIIDRVDTVEALRWALTYNSLGAPTRLTTTEAGIANTTTLSSSTTHGQLTGLANSNGATAQFTIDLRGKTRTAQLPGWSATFDHDARSLLQEVRYSSGDWVRLTYDASGVPVRVDDSAGGPQPVAGLADAPSSGASRFALRSVEELLGSARHVARAALARPLMHWLPLSDAQAQAVPPAIPANALMGLSRIPPASGAAAEGVAARNRYCCGQAAQTIARAIERRVAEITASARLAAAVAEGAVTTLADELVMLRTTDKLQKNMCRQLGTTKPENGCWEAHHIVGVASKKFPVVAESQKILAKFGMDIDDGNNGTFVECTQHHHLHTELYHTTVFATINSATTYSDLAGRLRLIAAQIANGKFPH